jgi:hypothetical protein
MPIGSLNDYIGAYKQVIPFCKTPTTIATVALGWYSTFDMAGNPGAGVAAGTSATAGVVPTDATPGVSPINFSTGTGYLSTVDFSNTVASRLMLADILWKGGTYANNSGTTTLSGQPSYSSRVPGGTDYTGLQIWIEVSTAFVSGTTWSVVVTYTDQDGNTGASTITTGSLAAAGLTKGRMYQLALASGDSGVRKIESVVVTTGGTTSGAFNVLVLRPLWSGRVSAANQGDCHGIDRTGMPIVFSDSAIALYLNADSTVSGLPDVQFEIASA